MFRLTARTADSESTRDVSNEAVQTAQLRQLITWMIPCAFIFALMEGVTFALLHDWPTLIAGGVILGYGGVLLVARACLWARRLASARFLVWAGMLSATLLIAPVQPAWLPTLVLMPPLVAAIALGQVGGRGLLYLLLSCWLVTVVTASIGEFSDVHSILPSGLVSVFRISSTATTVATLLLMLWQFNTRQQQMLRQTRAAEERYALAARGANDGLWDWNLETNHLFLSARWKTMLGYPEHLAGSPQAWFERVHPDDQQCVHTTIVAHLAGQTEHLESEHRIRCADGTYSWVLMRGLAVRDAGGQPIRIAGSQTDITVRKQSEAHLRYAAFHDPLTGLPNRCHLLDHLRRALQQAGHDPAYHFAMLLFDLDRFKLVNDSFDHGAGDELLVALAQRVQHCIRERDIFARLGGDELQMQRWQTQFAVAVPFTLSVNISGKQFTQPQLIAHICEIIRASGLRPHQLRLEITETVLVQHAEHTAALLTELQAFGVHVDIDDFGTGYSSLSTLHQFPSAALKVDRSFVQQFGRQGEHAEIVQAIVTLAHQLGMDVIVEGIETHAQLALLQAMGCDAGQGYFFFHPLTTTLVERLLTMLERDAVREPINKESLVAVV